MIGQARKSGRIRQREDQLVLYINKTGMKENEILGAMTDRDCVVYFGML